MTSRTNDSKDSSSRFFALLISLGLLSILVILVLAGLGLRNTYRHQIFDEAKQDAVQIVGAILYLEGESFLDQSSPEGWRVEIIDDQMPELDDRLRKMLDLFAISKIKIFDRDSRVVYSTDSAIIGQLNIENQRLARALAGQVDSSLKRKDSMMDLANEEGFDLDVVETYVPIFTEQNQLIGAIELYMDVTHYRQTISTLIKKNLSILAIVLLLVFAPVMLIVRTLTRRLSAVQAQLKKLASIDALTGVLSRREIMEQAKAAGLKPSLRQEIGHKEDSNGLMMLDIDLFKQINDNHGHLIGDTVLKIIAQRLVTSLRHQDLIGRFGGEEFLIILPNSSLETTKVLAERCRRLIGEAPVTCEGKTICVTVSIGISCYPIDRGEKAFMHALEEADVALYRAKSSGRNQTKGRSL